MRALSAATLALALTLASRASAATFPARTGESGLLDVPDAEVVGRDGGLLGAELRLDGPSGEPMAFGPFPIYVVAGLGERLEAGVVAREWGQPGDPVPAGVMFGGALKYQLLAPGERRLALALDVNADRVNTTGVYGGRLIASTAPVGRLKLAAFVGGETGAAGAAAGVTYGGAVSLVHRSGVEGVLEALGGPRGANYGAALRWNVMPGVGMQLGFNYLPADGFRVSVGFGFGPGPKPASAAEAARTAAGQPAAEEETAPQKLAFADDRPRFRLRLRAAESFSGEPRHLQHGAWAARAAGQSPVPPRPGAAKAPALTVDEVVESQLRELEDQVSARERRLRASAEQLAARDATAVAEGRRLAEREQGILAREQQLDARERRVGSRGAASGHQRQLESFEAQVAAQERQLSAQERGLGPAIEAAQGREADAAAREDAERQDASRLAASSTNVTTRSVQLELRKQAGAARSRQLAALEAALVARGERLDGVERQLRARGERLDAWQRRLDARAERLELLERRAAAPAAGPEPVAPRSPELAKEVREQKDKAVFVMVVKSPTAVVKERPAQPATGADAAAAGAAAPLHAGLAVEKAVAAATLVTFATPASQLGELDRESIDAVAKLAAKERCELLVWARAKDPSLMAEAQRRAAEIKGRVIAAGPLEPQQVVTRITTRPGSLGVDVVVSALRESIPGGQAKPAAAPAPAAPAAPAPAAPGLVSGETGRRQIRDAVVAAQPSIEACVGDLIVERKLARADGVLRLTVSPEGRITKVRSPEGDLAGADVEACLTKAAAAWRFPSADAEYVVDVPITVLRGGAAR